MFSYCAPPASRPAPRRTARSMLSLGTELFLAFWMASYNVGLPAGSPPPVRAATSMFLISRGELLATARVFDGLLVLGGCPLGMAAHRCPLPLSLCKVRVASLRGCEVVIAELGAPPAGGGHASVIVAAGSHASVTFGMSVPTV